MEVGQKVWIKTKEEMKDFWTDYDYYMFPNQGRWYFPKVGPETEGTGPYTIEHIDRDRDSPLVYFEENTRDLPIECLRETDPSLDSGKVRTRSKELWEGRELWIKTEEQLLAMPGAYREDGTYIASRQWRDVVNTRNMFVGGRIVVADNTSTYPIRYQLYSYYEQWIDWEKTWEMEGFPVGGEAEPSPKRPTIRYLRIL